MKKEVDVADVGKVHIDVESMEEKSLVPLGKNLLVRKAEKEKMHDLGNGRSLVLPRSGKADEVLHDVGVVVATGAAADRTWVGKAVLYEKYSGKDITIGTGQYSLIAEDDLLAWIK